MNLNNVVISGTVVRKGETKTENGGEYKSIILYIETNKPKVIANGEVIDKDLNPIRVKYRWYKDDYTPNIVVGMLLGIEGRLYSYKINYNGIAVFSTGIMARRLMTLNPLSRENRGLAIQAYKKEVSNERSDGDK